MSTSHVIILGCGRSGTSIFGELFDHLDPFSYYSEPSFDNVVKFDFTQPIALKVPEESPDYPPTQGLSFPLEVLLELSEISFQFYWQVRHPLDTICSLRVGIANNWGHHPKPPDWKAWLERPLIERCAHHWAYLNTVGYQQVQHLTKVKSFEDMLNNPTQFATATAEEVGLVSSNHQQALSDWARRVQNTNNEHFVEAETSKNYSRKDHTVRVERWRENLTREEIVSILPIIREGSALFDYDLPSNL